MLIWNHGLTLGLCQDTGRQGLCNTASTTLHHTGDPQLIPEKQKIMPYSLLLQVAISEFFCGQFLCMLFQYRPGSFSPPFLLFSLLLLFFQICSLHDLPTATPSRCLQVHMQMQQYKSRLQEQITLEICSMSSMV